MSDQSRYDYDITTGNRSYEDRSSGRGYSRNSTSMFDMDGSRDRDRDRDRDRGDNRVGGWAGSGRTSAYDQDEGRDRGRWTDVRENLTSDRDRDDHRERSGSERYTYRSHDYDRDRGERMSSGWGGLAGEDMDRSRRDRDRDEHYSRDDERRGLPREETSRLIASNKVEGTAVYGSDGERLGSIYNFMVGKRSGKVEYAVMSYGGFLGMGQRYYPLPWDMLTYDTREGGYHINMRERDLRDAPSFDRDSEPQFNRDYDRHVQNYYGTGR